MKTPKRDYKTPANQLAQDIESDFFEPEYHAQEARWKRKNRIKQLKRTIERLKKESIDNYFHGYNAGLQQGIEIGFLHGSKKLRADILFQRLENQK